MQQKDKSYPFFVNMRVNKSNKLTERKKYNKKTILLTDTIAMPANSQSQFQQDP